MIINRDTALIIILSLAGTTLTTGVAAFMTLAQLAG